MLNSSYINKFTGLLNFSKSKSNKKTEKIVKTKYSSSQVVFILVRQDNLILHKFDETKVFSLENDDNSESEESHIIDNDLQNIESIFEIISQLDFVVNQRLFFLVDHPFLEVKFLNLPYIPKAKTIRPIIAHALNKSFVRGLDNLNFCYECYKKENQIDLIVYATYKEFSDKLANLAQEKKIWLEGIYPMTQWFFTDFSLLQAGNLPDDFFYFDLANDSIKAIHVINNIPTQYWRMKFSTGMPIANQIIERLKILQFEGYDRQLPLFIEPRDDQSLEAAKILSPDRNFPVLPIDFNSLMEMYNRLETKKKLISMLRIANAWFKEAMRNYAIVKKVFVYFIIAISILAFGTGLQWFLNRNDLQLLNAQAEELIKRYNPAMTNFDQADQALDEDLTDQLQTWEIHQLFLYRTYEESEYFSRFQQIFDNNNITITKLSRDINTIQISGICENEDDLDKFITDYQNEFRNKEVEKNIINISQNRYQYTLNIN